MARPRFLSTAGAVNPTCLSGDSGDRRNRAGDAYGSRDHRALTVGGENLSNDHDPSAKGDRTWSYAHPSTAADDDLLSLSYGPSCADQPLGGDRNTAEGAAPDSEAEGSVDTVCVADMGCADRTDIRGFLHDSCRHQVGRPTHHPGSRQTHGSQTRMPAAKAPLVSSLCTSKNRST